MASIGGVSSNNTTSSLYNSANRISGLASGLDTEGMIESLVKSYQTKINQLNQKATKIEWKQEAYRGLISQMAGFSSKYTSYTSSTNLTSPSFFSNAVRVLTKGEYADRVTASGKTSSDIRLNAVNQLATAAQYRTKSNLVTTESGTIAGENADLFADDQIELSNLSGSLTLKYGSTSVSLSFSETNDVDAINDIRAKLAKEKGVAENQVADADVLAGLINQKLADEKIVFTSGKSESADSRIKATANADGTISFEELGTAKNGVYISNASGNVGTNLGLSETDLKNASETKPSTVKLRNNYDSSGLTRKLSGIEYLAEKSSDITKTGGTMNMSLDGVTKSIALPHVKVVDKGENGKEYWLNGEEIKATTNEDGTEKTAEEVFVEKYTESLKKSVKDAFGEKVTVENKGTGGKMQLEFKAKNEGSDLVINATAGDALGIGRIATSYLNTSKTLKDLMGDDLNKVGGVAKDENGMPVLDEKTGKPMWDFVINGVKIGTYTEDTQLSKIMSDINSNADAGVKVAYSQATQSFTFTSKETGADSKIEMGEGLAEAIFGSTEISNGSPKFADAYGVQSWVNDIKFKFEDSTITLKNFNQDDTIEDIANRLNEALGNNERVASYNKYTGQLEIKDKDGATVDFKAYVDDEDLGKVNFDFNKDYAPSVSYTPGQDAKFSVTINGETKNMVRSSNSVTIDGLTINMNETFNGYENKDGTPAVDNAGRPKNAVTFQSKTDSDKIIDAIKAMADDYNKMMADVKKAYNTMPYQKSNGSFANYEPLTDEEREGMSESAIERYEEKAKQGILFGDRDLSAFYSKMSQVFSFTNKQDVDTLKDMGIELTYSITDGTQALKVDEEKLRKMLDSDPDRVSDLFTKTDGIMDRMKNHLDTYAKTTGEPKGILVQTSGTPLSSLSLMNNQWQKQIDNINTEIEKWQDKLSNQVDRYTSMFSRLEQLINQMNSQSSTLAGLMGG